MVVATRNWAPYPCLHTGGTIDSDERFIDGNYRIRDSLNTRNVALESIVLICFEVTVFEAASEFAISEFDDFSACFRGSGFKTYRSSYGM
jgi:hypothetical protein